MDVCQVHWEVYQIERTALFRVPKAYLTTCLISVLGMTEPKFWPIATNHDFSKEVPCASHRNIAGSGMLVVGRKPCSFAMLTYSPHLEDETLTG
jgi:hypothetical protein